MAAGRPDPGQGADTSEPRDQPDDLSQRIAALERRLLAGLALAVLIVVVAYAWLQPDLNDPADRQAVLLGLVSLLSLLTALGLGLLVRSISQIRDGFQQRDAARERLVREANEHARRLEAYSRQLERRNEDLRRFAYVVAHDLREPARTVSTHASLARREASGDLGEEVGGELDRAVEAAQHLDRLLGDLLAYVTVDQHVDEPEPVDLESVLDEALMRLEADVDRAGAEIVTGSLPTVRGHRPALVRMLEELVANAIKFTPDEQRPYVEVDAEETDDGWMLEVADDGIGMPPRHTDRVFSMFERLHRREEIPGTGAGLSICRRIAELHGGDIELDSTPGEGLTVHVEIPRQPTVSAEAALEKAGLDRAYEA